MQKATFGGGCFWCLEAPLERIKGIHDVVSGYAGGDEKDPTDEEVSSKSTGHAEVVQITFNPDIISYQELLDIFFELHDPTTLNRQGPDTGIQYRSIILYHTKEQKITAENTITRINDSGKYQNPVVTEVVEFIEFFEAEYYHQNYYERNRFQPYCQMNVVPKIKKIEKIFKDRLK